MAVSLYSTKVKGGDSNRNEVLPEIENKIPYYYDYYKIFENWAGVFGHKNMIIRKLEQDKLVNNNLIHDFLDACDINQDSSYIEPENINVSISPLAQEFLLEFNKHVPLFVKHKLTPTRQDIHQLMENHFPRKGKQPTRKAAMDFFEKFRETNNQLALACMSGKESCFFSEDFSHYPIKEVNYNYDFNDAVEVAARLWLDKCHEVDRLQAEAWKLRGKIHRLRQNHSKAKACFKKANTYEDSQPPGEDKA